jgi:hypothetical protein
MEKKKLDWIIQIIREQMVTGSTAGAPGFSEKSPVEGPTAGMSPVVNFDGRSRVARRLPSPYRVDLIKKKKKSTP